MEKREREPWRRGSTGEERGPRRAQRREKEGTRRANKPSERVFSLALTQRRRAMHLSWRTHCETGSVSLAHAYSRRARASARVLHIHIHTTRARSRARSHKVHSRDMSVHGCTMQLRASRTCLCQPVYVHRRVGTGPTRGPEARSNSRTVDTDLTQRPAAVHTIVPPHPSASSAPSDPFPLTVHCLPKVAEEFAVPTVRARRLRERRCWSRRPKSLPGGHLVGVGQRTAF